MKRYFRIIVVLLILFAGPPQALRAATLTAAYPREPLSLDPHGPPDPAAWPFIFSGYQRLVTLKGATNELQPSLAVTWRISDDARLYTVVIKENQKFADGRPIDANAVRWSFDRAMEKGIVGPIYFRNLAGIDVLGPYTLRFILRRPEPSFLHSLTIAAASIVSPAVFGYPADYLDRHMLGSGPYRMDSWEPGRSLTLSARFETSNQARITKFKAVFKTSSVERTALLRQNSVQIVQAPDENDNGSGSESITVPDTTSVLLGFNCRRPRLADPRARLALAGAIDKHTLRSLPGIAVLDGGCNGLFPDPETGATGGSHTSAGNQDRPLALVFPSSPPWIGLVAAAIKVSLAEAGVSVELFEKNSSDYEASIGRGGFDLALMTPRRDVPHPWFLLNRLLNSSRPGLEANPAFFSNPEVDGLLEEARPVRDMKRGPALWRRIGEAAAREVPYVCLFSLKRRYLISGRVKNYTINPNQPDRLPLLDMTLEPDTAGREK